MAIISINVSEGLDPITWSTPACVTCLTLQHGLGPLMDVTTAVTGLAFYGNLLRQLSLDLRTSCLLSISLTAANTT